MLCSSNRTDEVSLSMEIKLINAAYQDKKQMKHAKTTSYPQKGEGGAKFPPRLVTTFSLMLKLRVGGFSECLPYKAVEPFGLASSPWADFGQGERKEKEGRKEGRERLRENQRYL